MERIIELLARTEVSAAASAGYVSRDPGSSSYPWDNTPSKSLEEVWNDDANTTYEYFQPHKNNGGIATVLAGWKELPSLILIKSVKIRALWSLSQQGPNNWYEPSANTFRPRLRFAVRNRAASDNVYSPWRELTAQELLDHDENVNTGVGYVGPLTQEWESTTHPEGGPWTVQDLSVANFVAGFQAQADAPAYTDEQGDFYKLRVHQLRLFVTVEDLGGFVENVRNATSLTLRFRRRARNTIKPACFAHQAAGTMMGRVYMTHPKGPAVRGGWGRRRLERRPGILTKRTIHPGAFRVEDEVFDSRYFDALFWAAYRIDCAWSPELQGVAYIDKGNGWTHDRAQSAWSPRKGDGALMRVIEDYPNVSYRGLAAAGDDDSGLALHNTNLMGTGWSSTGVTGGLTISAENTRSIVQENGYLYGTKFAFGASGSGVRVRSLGTVSRNTGALIHVRVGVQNISVPTPESQFLEWMLLRTGTRSGAAFTDYWDATTRTWGYFDGNPPPVAIPSDDAYGESVCDAIPCDTTADADPAYLIQVGRMSAGIAGCEFIGALVDVQLGGPLNGASYGARPPLVQQTDIITREADVHRLVNGTGADEIWSYERGTAMIECQPYWRAAAMPDDTIKTLLHARHAFDTYDGLQFVAKAATPDLIRFERAVSGQTTFTLDCPIANDLSLTRDHVLRAWVRWLGPDGWVDYAPWSVEVGYAVFLESTGAFVQQGSVLGAFAYTGNVADRDWVGLGNDDVRFLDADIRCVEFRRNPLFSEEIVWRL